MAEEAIAVDADNLVYVDIGAKAYAGLGSALNDAGQIAGAGTAIEHARELATRLVQRDPSVVAWQIDLSRALMLQARVSAPESTALDTLRNLQGALQRIESLEQSSRMDREARSLHASVLVACGEEYRALGNREQADDAWKRAIALSGPGYEGAEPRVRADVTIALRRLGRGDEAANLFAGLENMGYRDPEFLRSWARIASDESVSEASPTNAQDVN